MATENQELNQWMNYFKKTPIYEAVPFGYNRIYKHPISDVKVEFRLPRISIKNVNQGKIENHLSKLSDKFPLNGNSNKWFLSPDENTWIKTEYFL